MNNICFVCTGNACRSPFAESVLTRLLADVEIDDCKVWSCGTLNWGVNPRDEIMVEIARKMGYVMGGTTTFMTSEVLNEADRIIVFESRHRDAITRVLDYGHWDRIILFDSIAFGQNTEVMDPHYQSMRIYEDVAKHIEDGCMEILKKCAR